MHALATTFGGLHAGHPTGSTAGHQALLLPAALKPCRKFCSLGPTLRKTSAAFAASPVSVLQLRPRVAQRKARTVVISAAGVDHVSLPTWHPTGVPLVDHLAGFESIQQSGIEAIKLMAITTVALTVAGLVLRFLCRKMSNGDGDLKEGEGFIFTKAVISSVSKPADTLLRFWGIIYTTTVAASFAQVAATTMKKEFNALCFGYAPVVLKFVESLTQLSHNVSQVIFIVGAAWTAIELKERVLAYLQTNVFQGQGMRLLITLGSLLNYLVYAGAIFASLSAFGVNITPLLASTGGLSLVVGLASQSILNNVASAVTLYTSPPFAAGDSVKFLVDGKMVLEGRIVAIEPMRTVLRNSEGALLYVNNKTVTNYIIQNDSRRMTESGSL